MKIIDNTVQKLESNQNLAYSYIRIFLGTALLIRGLILFSNPAALIELAGSDQEYWYFSYITISHLIGGLCLAIGLLTRFAALIQIPVLAGAVFVVHLEQGLMSAGQSLELAVLVLVLLGVYFLFGSGLMAVDKLIEDKKRAV
ncbi:MAG: DoxX family protein [Calditrichaeota bacterium]|nr:DoxX family protein [Calditrichota bacterium]